jgi:ferredoxin
VTFVITQPCIEVRDQSCVEVCPVDCIHFEEGEDRMLYIEPVACIDCGACEPACPVNAIYAEADLPADQAQFTAINVLWYSDAAAARAQVAGIPALEGAEEARAAAEARASSEGAAVATAVADGGEAAAEPSRGLYKYGEGGIEGKCVLCGTYVTKGGTMFRAKSVVCPDCAPKAERITNPYRRTAGRR